jgi:DMSO reductase anchor subunit
MVDTIASWNTWYVPLTIIGFTLIGGAIIGTLVLAFAGSLDEAVQGRFKVLAIVLALVGAVLAVGALTLQYFMVGSLSSLLVSGSQVTGELTVFLVVFGVGIALSLAIVLYTLLKDRRGTFSLAATVLVTASIFIGRLMFYSMFMTVGI